METDTRLSRPPSPCHNTFFHTRDVSRQRVQPFMDCFLPPTLEGPTLGGTLPMKLASGYTVFVEIECTLTTNWEGLLVWRFQLWSDDSPLIGWEELPVSW